MSSETLHLTDHEDRVYKRFCRAFMNIPVCFGREIVLLEEEEKELHKAFSDANALCEEVEDDNSDIMSLDYKQISMLAMIAAADVTEQLSLQLLSIDVDGDNFNG